MSEKKRRGLYYLISQKPTKVLEGEIERAENLYTKTIGFKVNESQYEIYGFYSKYFNQHELIEVEKGLG